MAKVYLAYSLPGQPTVLSPECKPIRALVSFAYKDDFLKSLAMGMKVEDWVLDSGAYSAKHAGTKVTIDDFCRGIDTMSQCKAGPPKEVYSLDVIGDWRSTKKNCEALTARGYKVIPTYHLGEPIEVLKDYAQYPKIALGGVARLRKGPQIERFLDAVFSAVWPKALHGFAAVRPQVLNKYPIDSVDSTTWRRTPMRYGFWPGVGNLRVRNSKMPLVWTVEYYRKLERESESRFRSQLEEVRGV